MVQRHVSMRGEVIDMNRMRNANAETIALGNANKNARGDIVGKGGVILKTQEQIEAEWAANKRAREASVKPMDIKSEIVKKQEAPKAKEKPLDAEDRDFNPATATETPAPKVGGRRRITETDS